MLIIDQNNSDFEFSFDSGEHKGESYIGSIRFCTSPTCTCKEGLLTLKSNPVNKKESSNICREYSFAIDIDQKTVGKRDDVGISDMNFAKSFIKDLTKEEWERLLLNYLSFKTYITETAKPTEINTVFPDELTRDGSMVEYHEILPFGERIYITIDDEKYLVTDQYCVQPHCKCNEVFLGFCPLTKDGAPLKKIRECFAIEYDYKKDSWKVYQNYQKKYDIKTFPGLCMEALKGKKTDLFSFLEKRHNKLKVLYKQYLKNNKPDIPDQTDPVYGKISRNDRCPCGSGKKYKKCCINK